MRFHLIPATLALLSAVAGTALVTHYPLAPAAAAVAAAVCTICFYAWPAVWLLVIPAALPVIGFAPWSGWITFEELDILILAVAAGGYARLAWRTLGDVSAVKKGHRHIPNLSLGVWLLAGMFALATAVAIYRGFVDAGGFSFGWYQGYHEPMNSVRVGKSFFLALLLLPLWQAACKQNHERAQGLLSSGLMLGLAAAALSTIWERVAFVDLLNFSADYRTTGLFWEMHVGGAALDGFLALTVPFAVRELMAARSSRRWGLAAAVLALAAFACLTTFSRGVYLALPMGMLVFFGLTARNLSPGFAGNHGEPAESQGQRPWQSVLVGLLLVTGFAVGSAWMFQSSGYRGMAALLGTVALMLPMVQVLRGLTGRQWLVGLALGVLLSLATIAITLLVPKGAYFAWALASVFTVAMLWLKNRADQPTSFFAPLALAAFLAMVMSTALVASHWGGYTGLRHSVPVLLGVLSMSVVAVVWRVPVWPVAIRWQATAAGAMGLVAAVVGVMGGGAYMSDRFSTSVKDLDGRLAHWQLGQDMLRTPADLWLGKGMGRFPANYFLNGSLQQHPGDYRLIQDGTTTYITIAGGTQVGGESLRVSQRVAEPGSQAVVTAQVQAETNVTLHFEVCAKHLLYSQGCISKSANIKGAPGVWQDLQVVLQGAGANRGAWYAPRLLVFSAAMGTLRGKAHLDNLALTTADGQQLLANSDFSDGLAHWFSSSDRNHLPWHIKNLLMNELFDQGIVGLCLWMLLFLWGLWRLSFGPARTHPIGPALAAGLVGFAVVGLFDSLLDVPRIAWLYYFFVLVALTLQPPPSQRGSS